MLAALAAVALVVGGISTANVLTSEERAEAQGSPEAVVEVQTIETVESDAGPIGF
jgi:hypothetical protein